MPYPIPDNEAKRLDAIRRYGLLDTPAEQSFDDFAYLASHLCETPIALITLVDAGRQWFKARLGLEVSETPREHAFCAHTIMTKQLMVVEDALSDSRFADNPLVTSDPHIRFYAGAPLIDRSGFGLGTLCVIDRQPRHLTASQTRSLEALARQVVVQCEFRRISSDLAAVAAEAKTLRGLLPICSHCKSIRNDQGYWRSVEEYLEAQTEADFSHGICPSCLRVHHPWVCEELEATQSP